MELFKPIVGITIIFVCMTLLGNHSSSSDSPPNPAQPSAPTLENVDSNVGKAPPSPQAPGPSSADSMTGGFGGDFCLAKVRGMPKPIPTIRLREELAPILDDEKMEFGVELGVQRGKFAEHTLSAWPAAKKYVLVDLWAPQANYRDSANAGQKVQNAILGEALHRTNKWKEKVQVCRNFTTACAAQFDDEYFDYIYVDARHDRAGVHEDLVAWWPKLKCGGIMAGHDYVTQPEIDKLPHRQDWTLNFDGTRDKTGLVVRGAVDDFFMGNNSAGHVRQVVATYREWMWNTWYVRK